MPHCPASAANLIAWARSASGPRERSPLGVSTTASAPETACFVVVAAFSAARSNPAAPTGFRGSENVLVGESAAALPVPLSRRERSLGLHANRRLRGTLGLVKERSCGLPASGPSGVVSADPHPSVLVPLTAWSTRSLPELNLLL